MTAEPRSYESPLRAEQRDATRNRVLEAAVEELAGDGVDELTIPLVARRAGVSVRTVYAHFPTKDALFEAIAGFDADEKLYTVALRSKAGREVAASRRGKRIAELERALAQDLAGLDQVARRRALAAVYVMQNIGSWRAMKDYFGLSGSEAGEAAAWAIRAMLRELRRSPGELEGAHGQGDRAARSGEQAA